MKYPSEEELVKTAKGFSMDYRKLLQTAREREDMVSYELTGELENFMHPFLDSSGKKG